MKIIIVFSLISIFIKSQNIDFIDSIYNDEDEKSNKYFYHSDHLGSTSYVTDSGGSITQHHAYVPFGENFVSEYNKAYYKSDYRFNSKELDSNTGFYYYGARYYNPKTSLWHGTDPLAEKYPNISPYAYVALNPIKYIDPDGKRIELSCIDNNYIPKIMKNLNKLTSDRLYYDKEDKQVKINQKTNFFNTLLGKKLKNTRPEGTRLIRELINNLHKLEIEDGEGYNESRSGSKSNNANILKDDKGGDAVVQVYYGAKVSQIVLDTKKNKHVSKKVPHYILLGHELIHGLHDFYGNVDMEKEDYTTLSGEVKKIPLKEEYRTVGISEVRDGDITENQLRKEHKNTKNTKRDKY